MVEEAGVIKEVWFANPHILRVGSNNMPEKSLFSNVYFKKVFLHSPCSDNKTTGVVIFKSLIRILM